MAEVLRDRRRRVPGVVKERDEKGQGKKFSKKAEEG